MENKNLTCIGCPMGCLLTVTYDINDPSNITVTGNTCNRGKLYGITEVTSPTRTVTGTVKVANRHTALSYPYCIRFHPETQGHLP